MQRRLYLPFTFPARSDLNDVPLSDSYLAIAAVNGANFSFVRRAINLLYSGLSTEIWTPHSGQRSLLERRS
jgi:hypothetical protein